MDSRHSSQLNIVICTYNAATHLRGCLLSIAAQQDPDIRLWIFDGASTDDTLKIVDEFHHLIHHVESMPDKGVYDAMNRAACTVPHGWLLFLGADDRLMPNAISRLRRAWPQLPPDTGVVYGDVYRPRANAVYDGEFSRWKLVRRNICQQAVLYESDVLKRFPLDVRFPINADHVLNLRLVLSGIRFSYVKVCLAYYEDVADGISRDRGDADFINFRRSLIRQYGDWPLFMFACAIDVKQRLWLKCRKLLGV